MKISSKLLIIILDSVSHMEGMDSRIEENLTLFICTFVEMASTSLGLSITFKKSLSNDSMRLSHENVSLV